MALKPQDIYFPRSLNAVCVEPRRAPSAKVDKALARCISLKADIQPRCAQGQMRLRTRTVSYRLADGYPRPVWRARGSGYSILSAVGAREGSADCSRGVVEEPTSHIRGIEGGAKPLIEANSAPVSIQHPIWCKQR
jgi:hypothetical protein